jgi:hypothetical protein
MSPNHITLQSAPLKKPIKEALVEVDKAIAQGQAAVAKSEKDLQADPTNNEKALKLRQNQELLAKAEYLKSGLEMSEKLANFMCPLQVAMLEFDYVD